MEVIRVVSGETLNIWFDILNGGIGVTGETPTLELQRESDNMYWSSTTGLWDPLVQPNVMLEHDLTNEEGLYRFSYTFPPVISETYIAHKINTGANARDEYAYYISTPTLTIIHDKVINLPAAPADQVTLLALNNRIPASPADQIKFIAAIQRLSDWLGSDKLYKDLE